MCLAWCMSPCSNFLLVSIKGVSFYLLTLLAWCVPQFFTKQLYNIMSLLYKCCLTCPVPFAFPFLYGSLFFYELLFAFLFLFAWCFLTWPPFPEFSQSCMTDSGSFIGFSFPSQVLLNKLSSSPLNWSPLKKILESVDNCNRSIPEDP